MKKITLDLTVEDVRALYQAVIRLQADDEQAISVAEQFPKSAVLREAGKQATERKATMEGITRRMLSGLTDEQWRAVIFGKD